MADEQEAAAPEVEAAPESVVDADQGADQKEQQPTTEAAPDSPQDTGGETPDGGEEKTASQKRRERRKRQLSRERSDYQSEVANLTAVLNEEEPKTPKPDDFPDPDEYQAELVAARYDQRQQEKAKEQAKQRLDGLRQLDQQEVATLWQETVEDGREKYTDFDTVTDGRRWPCTPEMAEVIVTSDHSEDIAYYLGSNPKEAKAIAVMSPAAQGRALGRIEAKVSSPEPKTQTTAPPPINPVKPKSNPPVSMTDLAKKQDATEYMRMRNAELEKGL